MIDSHVHLDDAKFGGDVDGVLGRARDAGVRAMITAGVDLESSRAILNLAEQHADVYVAVGFHPHDAVKMRPEDRRELLALAAHPKVVAIGEIGLDYFRDHSPQDVQRRALREQLDLAAEAGLPVVVHNREADADMYALLREWVDGLPAGPVREQPGMLHCFSQDLASARRYFDLGFYISIAGPVTYPNAPHTREVAAQAPLERLLTETDAPYLPPQTQRGKRNEPANVAAVAALIASLRGMAPGELGERTAANAARLFRLPAAVAAGGAG